MLNKYFAPRYILLLLFIVLCFSNCSWLTGQKPLNLYSGWDRAEAILDRIQEPLFPDRDYFITHYGATGEGQADCREAFATAINTCNSEGGGRVVVPAGTYLCNGPIHLKSNVHLYLEEGATIKFGADPEFYLPVVLTKWEGTELFNYSPLIYAYQATNIAMTGKGIIDGSATTGFATWKPQQKEAQNRLRQMGNDGVPVNERIFGEGHYLRPSMVQPFGCKNVLIDGVTILDSPFWVIHPVFCINVIVRNVTVNSWNPNNDGCDPDASVNVLIENCLFNTGDDGIAIKSGRDQDGWRIGQATENVVIRNCEMRSKANGLCIGSEMSGSVRHVYMENCLVDSANSTVYFKANLDRGGRIENVWVRDVKVNRAKGAFIRFETNYKGHRGNFYPPLFQNFVLEKITCQTADNYAIFAEGHERARLKNILLKNITVNKAKVDRYIRYAENFRLRNVRINGVIQPELPPMDPEEKKKSNMGW